MTNNWPRYEPVTFSTGVNVSPEDLVTLNGAGLPKVGFGVGRIVEVPVGVDMPGRGYLIRLVYGRREGIYFDPSTGEVVWISDQPGPKPQLVNTTLGQFTRTVKALIDAFPFYSDFGGMDPNEVDVDVLCGMYNASAARLADLIRAIDPAALAPDGYWQDFLVDVMNGDYSTKDILRAHQERP